MFGLVFYGAFAFIPFLLVAVFIYPKVKHKLNKIIKAMLFGLFSFSAYAFCGMLYLGALALTKIKPDDLSFVFVFVVAAVYFVIRRKLPNPKPLGLFLLPVAVVSVVLLYYWIRCAVLYGANGSAEWISYTMFDAIPFGAAFSELQMLSGWGWLHIFTAIFPLFSAFIGAGAADFLSEKENALKIN